MSGPGRRQESGLQSCCPGSVPQDRALQLDPAGWASSLAKTGQSQRPCSHPRVDSVAAVAVVFEIEVEFRLVALLFGTLCCRPTKTAATMMKMARVGPKLQHRHRHRPLHCLHSVPSSLDVACRVYRAGPMADIDHEVEKETAAQRAALGRHWSQRHPSGPVAAGTSKQTAPGGPHCCDPFRVRDA